MGWWLVASQEALGSHVIGSIRNMAMAVVAYVDSPPDRWQPRFSDLLPSHLGLSALLWRGPLFELE